MKACQVSSIFAFFDCEKLSNEQRKQVTTTAKRVLTGLPQHWNHLGSGGAPGWCREEQYIGPYETRHGAKRVLERYYNELLQRGLITKYKLRYSYKP
jgi:hypothetical protein